MTPICGGWTKRQISFGNNNLAVNWPAEPKSLCDHEDQWWAYPWECSFSLIKMLLQAEHSVKNVLELGCGIGLVGLAALTAGHRVVFTDSKGAAVDVALDNARSNGFKDCAKGLVLNWTSTVKPDLGKFPLILGSDVIYDQTTHDALFDMIDHMLHDDGECWLSDPGNIQAKSFARHAPKRGFNVKTLNVNLDLVFIVTRR